MTRFTQRRQLLLFYFLPAALVFSNRCNQQGAKCSMPSITILAKTKIAVPVPCSAFYVTQPCAWRPPVQSGLLKACSLGFIAAPLKDDPGAGVCDRWLQTPRPYNDDLGSEEIL